MPKSPDSQMDRAPRQVTDERQSAFEFVEPFKYDWQIVGLTPHGYGLYRRQEGHGGWAYVTDQYGVEFGVYDSGVSDLISTFAAMVHENRRDAELMWNHLGVVFGFKVPLQSIAPADLPCYINHAQQPTSGNPMELKQIDDDKLAVGQTVFYRYSKRTDMTPTGPFRVTRITRGVLGAAVHVKHELANPPDERIVYLADDDDYGQPIFYA